MSTATIEETPTKTEKLFAETDLMSIGDYIEYNLNATSEDVERLYFYKTFTTETYEHIVTLRDVLRQNIKSHARLLSHSKQAYRAGESANDRFTQEYSDIIGKRFKGTHLSIDTLNNMKESYRVAHILLSILKGNRIFEIENKTDMDEHTYNALKRRVFSTYAQFAAKFPWMTNV